MDINERFLKNSKYRALEDRRIEINLMVKKLHEQKMELIKELKGVMDKQDILRSNIRNKEWGKYNN